MFVNDFYVWVERISRNWDRKQTLNTLKEINRVKRLLENKLNNKKESA